MSTSLLGRIQMADAAVKTLENLGYTYHGGEVWKPPLGPKPEGLDTPVIASNNPIHQVEAEILGILGNQPRRGLMAPRLREKLECRFNLRNRTVSLQTCLNALNNLKSTNQVYCELDHWFLGQPDA